jgi:exonuclease SbcD
LSRFRFIHTSDIHLDTSFSGLGFPSRLGDRKREAIRGTFRRIMEDAVSGDVALVLIPGDLFEQERVTPDTVEFLRRLFQEIRPVRVFIAPGNHDPLTTGSPYGEEPWPDNVHIFDKEGFQSVEIPDLGVRVTGFGFERPHLEDRFVRTLPVLSKEYFNIVMFHGSDITRIPSGKSKHGPFTIGDIAGKNVQYCALGHYHRQYRLPNAIDDTPVWYSGIPEGRGWDESGSCSYLWGEVAEGALKIEKRQCGRYVLNTLEVDCDGFTTREQILDAITSRRDDFFDSGTILRVRLVGSPDPRLDLSVSELDERLAGEALHIQWDDDTLPAWNFESLAREKSLRGRFVRHLNERIASSEGEERIFLERARLYGLEALSGHEVRLR